MTEFNYVARKLVEEAGGLNDQLINQIEKALIVAAKGNEGLKIKEITPGLTSVTMEDKPAPAPEPKPKAKRKLSHKKK